MHEFEYLHEFTINRALERPGYESYHIILLLI